MPTKVWIGLILLMLWASPIRDQLPIWWNRRRLIWRELRRER